jgi:hypothetical protein
MQAQIRSAEVATQMDANERRKFVNAHIDSKLIKPEDVGHVIAALSIHAPKKLSGQYVTWDGEECREFMKTD